MGHSISLTPINEFAATCTRRSADEQHVKIQTDLGVSNQVDVPPVPSELADVKQNISSLQTRLDALEQRQQSLETELKAIDNQAQNPFKGIIDIASGDNNGTTSCNDFCTNITPNRGKWNGTCIGAYQQLGPDAGKYFGCDFVVASLIGKDTRYPGGTRVIMKCACSKFKFP
jgi:hypothetical protein